MFIDKETGKRVNIYTTYKGYSKLDTPAIREKAGVIEIPDPLAPDWYVLNPSYGFRIEIDVPPYVIWEERAPEQIQELKLEEAKTNRKLEVESITVTISTGKVFDGNEDAQNRMNRAITSLEPFETITWVLADSTPTIVTREELKEALRLAGEAQTSIWVKPYTQA